ncbi:unnamed protein product [Rotaria sp. Silwood1]|nr:unnamed protein product [Rotaria sp. Silwood1]CAF4886156.1 unnamed protein product [Rotaria sp. Silwood1]
MGEGKFTFVEGYKNSKSVTILLKGCIIPGDGAFEIVAHQVLTQYKKQVKDRACLGVQAFAESLLIISKAITQNTGHNQQETIVKFQQDYATSNYQLASILQQKPNDVLLNV